MVVCNFLTMGCEKNSILADSQRKGVIMGGPLGWFCGDVNYAN